MVGSRLKELRVSRGLTQKQLADDLQIGWHSISCYEREIASPDDDLKVRLARYFDISLDYLLGLVDEPISYRREDYIPLQKESDSSFKAELKKLVRWIEGIHIK